MTTLHSPLTITDLLRDANLSQYEPAFLKQGADDIQQLLELPDEDLKELLQLTGMESKPFHIMRLMKILGRANSKPPEATTAMETMADPLQTMCDTGASHTIDTEGNCHSTALVNTHTVTVYATQIDAASDPILSAGGGNAELVYPSPLADGALTGTDKHTTSSTVDMLQQYNELFARQQEQQQQQHTHPLIHQPSVVAMPTDSSVSGLPLQDTFIGASDERFQFVKSADMLSSLLDDSVPIQKRLSPPLFSPNIWDSGRMEIIREASKLYSSSKTSRDGSTSSQEPLGSFEQSMNEASYQLCLYDPTLLVRKDELFLLANKCVVRSSCKRKAGDSTSDGSSKKSRKKVDRSSANAGVNRGSDGKFVASFEANYEMREKEMQALDNLIAENLRQQKTKQAQLVAAQQKKDYSTALKLQEELSSLGQIHNHLRAEMARIRKTQRRSVRNQEIKQKKEVQNKAAAVAETSTVSSGDNSIGGGGIQTPHSSTPSVVYVTSHSQHISSTAIPIMEDNNSIYMQCMSTVPTCFNGTQTIDSKGRLINTTAGTTPPPLLLDTSTTTTHGHQYNTDIRQ